MYRAVKILLVGLLCAALTPGLPQGTARQATPPGAAPTGKSFEDLLKEAKLLFNKQVDAKNNRVFYKIAVEAGGETSMITCEEKPWTWKFRDGSPLRSIYAFANVTSLEKDQRVSPAALRKIAELNDRILIGNCSLSGTSIDVNSGFYLQGLTGELVEFYVYNLHWRRVEARKEILPILRAEGEEKK